jgi:hypothetical protein
VGFVVDKITLGFGVRQVLWLCSVIVIPQMLHTQDAIESSVGNRGLRSTKPSLSLGLSLFAG